MTPYIASKSAKVLRTDKKKKLVSLFLPPNVTVTELSTLLVGHRYNSKKVTGVGLFYTYLFKNVLYNGDRDTERWVQVSWADCRTMLGSDYAEVLNLLVKENYLERLEHNEEGVVHKHGHGHYWNTGTGKGECKKYRIPVHLLSKDKLFYLCKEPLTTLLLNKITALSEPITAIKEQYRELALFNMSDVILLDTPGSRAVLDQLCAEGNIHLNADEYLDLINYFPLEVPVVCEFGHRAHHRIVRIHHALRPWLRFKDDLASELVEVDVVASQPTILANITPVLIKKYAPECAAAIPLFEKYSQRADYNRYRELCFSGLLYEYLRDEYNNAYPSQWVPSATRDDAKKMVFVAFFSNYEYREGAAGADVTEKNLLNYLMAENDQQAAASAETLFKKNSYQLFKRLFPSLHLLFSEIKALHWDFNPGEQHSNNCLLAQRIESGIIYTKLVKALVDAGITRFTTTHDAINVKKQEEKKARRVIQAAIKKQGLKMLLKTKEQVKGAAKEEEVMQVVEPSIAAEAPTASIAAFDDVDAMLAKLEAQFVDIKGELVEHYTAESYNEELETLTDEQRLAWTINKLKATPTTYLEGW